MRIISLFFLSNSTSGSLRTCVNMLGQYCTSGLEMRTARALTDYFNYICTTQGQNGDVNFITVYLLYYSIMLLWYRDELADEKVTNIISWRVFSYFKQLTALHTLCFVSYKIWGYFKIHSKYPLTFHKDNNNNHLEASISK